MTEARYWAQRLADEEEDFSWNYFPSKQGFLTLVNRLYNAGAKKVFASTNFGEMNEILIDVGKRKEADCLYELLDNWCLDEIERVETTSAPVRIRALWS